MDPRGLASYQNHSSFSQCLEAEGRFFDTCQVRRYYSWGWQMPSSRAMEASGPAWSARGYSALFCHRGRLDDVDMVDVVYRLAKDREGKKELKERKSWRLGERGASDHAVTICMCNAGNKQLKKKEMFMDTFATLMEIGFRHIEHASRYPSCWGIGLFFVLKICL